MGEAATAHRRAPSLRDAYGFEVKTEYRALHAIHSANWVEEEEERGTRWYAFLTELAASEGVGYGAPAAGCGDAEADAALLERAMSHYEACASRSSSPGDVAGTPAGGAPCAAGAACARRLRALVQAGVPMSHRGAFWKLFLGVASKRQPGEYDALVAKAFDGVAEPDARGDGGAASPAAPAASAWAAVSKGAKPYHMSMPCYAGGPPVVEIVADARGVLPPQCDIFQLIPLLDSPDKGAALAAGAEGPPATPGALPAAKPLPDECCRTPASSLVPPTCSSGRPTASPGSAWSPEAWQASDYLGQIEKDLHRTFPNHPSMDAAGRAMLRRILAAFARRSPRVGYCQGLNFIAAAFALFMEEEDAFWCLAAVVEDLLPGYFETRMVAPQVDQLVLAHLLQGGFPTVWRHLQSLDVDPTSATLHWYLCLFLNSLPLETCLRVWDVLFFEGSPVVLFRVALALVETYSQALLATRESSDVFMLLQSLAPMSFDASGLLSTACLGFGHIKDAALQCLRQKYRGEVLQAMRVSVTSEEEFRELCEHHEDPCSTLHSARTCGMRCGEAWQGQLAEQALRVPSSCSPGSSRASRYGNDSGHFSPSRSSGSSHRSMRSRSFGSSSREASPLEKIKLAVGALSARLSPAGLPSLLPAGPLGRRGAELSPAGTGQRVARPSPARLPVPPLQLPLPGALRRISTGRSADGSEGLGELQQGASLARKPALTPFSEPAVVLGTEPDEALSEVDAAAAAPAASPPRPLLPAVGASTLPPTPASQQPMASQPPQTVPHRRALTALPTHMRSRRRRPIAALQPPNLLTLAEFKLDLSSAAVAAAFEIAARVSPTVAQSSAARERQLSGGRLPGHAVAEAAASGAGAAGCALPGQARTAAEDYPVRALQFELCGVELDACQPGTAPAAVGGPAADNSPFADEAWAARRYTEGDATEGMLHQTPGPAAPAEQRVQEPRLQGAVAAGGSGPQECRLLDVLAQLQEALAVGESRRHEAEHAASEARDMLQALEGQLAKVLTGVERKEAAAAELRSALAAAAPALAELEGELTAKRMAVEDGLRRLELKERQLASQEALVRHLMDMTARRAGGSPVTRCGG